MPTKKRCHGHAWTYSKILKDRHDRPLVVCRRCGTVKSEAQFPLLLPKPPARVDTPAPVEPPASVTCPECQGQGRHETPYKEYVGSTDYREGIRFDPCETCYRTGSVHPIVAERYRIRKQQEAEKKAASA